MAGRHLDDARVPGQRVITIERERLVTKLKDNREQHKIIYAEAIEGYWQSVRENLQALSEEAGELVNGDKLRTEYDEHDLLEDLQDLEKPTHHLKAYDQAINMFTWDEVEKIELTVPEFIKYVDDDWSWQNSFISSNTGYSETAKVVRRRRQAR